MKFDWSGLPPVEIYPGYEETDGAFLNARAIVNKRDRYDNFGSSPLIAETRFLQYLKEQNKKLPNEDFEFVKNTFPIIWDSFRGYVMKTEIGGIWNEKVCAAAIELFIAEFEKFPLRYKTDSREYINFAGLMLLSINKAIKSNKQILAQPIIEYVLILWVHYCLSLKSS